VRRRNKSHQLFGISPVSLLRMTTTLIAFAVSFRLALTQSVCPEWVLKFNDGVEFVWFVGLVPELPGPRRKRLVIPSSLWLLNNAVLSHVPLRRLVIFGFEFEIEVVFRRQFVEIINALTSRRKSVSLTQLVPTKIFGLAVHEDGSASNSVRRAFKLMWLYFLLLQ